MVTIDPPTERACERCDREERWDAEKQTFVLDSRDGDGNPGRPHCLHEWDINGRYNPLAKSQS